MGSVRRADIFTCSPGPLPLGESFRQLSTIGVHPWALSVWVMLFLLPCTPRKVCFPAQWIKGRDLFVLDRALWASGKRNLQWRISLYYLVCDKANPHELHGTVTPPLCNTVNQGLVPCLQSNVYSCS